MKGSHLTWASATSRPKKIAIVLVVAAQVFSFCCYDIDGLDHFTGKAPILRWFWERQLSAWD